jgi:uroporphyrin-3 C-methyltransferase
MKSDKHRAENADGAAAANNEATPSNSPDKGRADVAAHDKKSSAGAPAQKSTAGKTPTPAAEQPGAAPVKPPRSGIVLASLSLIAVIAASGGGAAFWYQYTDQQRHMERQLADVQQTADAAQKSAGELNDGLGELRTGVDGLKTSLQSMNDQLSAQLNGALGDIQTKEQALRESVQKLHDQLDRNSDDWIVAEAEYLIRVADQRLQLTRDTHTAVRALENADQRLRDMGDPSLLEVRKKITDDIVALRAVPDPDIEGMALTLSGLAKRVDTLPLAGGTAAPAAQAEGATGTNPAESGWRAFINRLWGQIKTLVVIQHRGDAGQPLLPPDERYFLRENLSLKLESARLALLRHDNATFHDMLDTAGQWLTKYFDPQDQAVISMGQSLKELAGRDLEPSLPDISDALNALHGWETKHGTKAADNGPRTYRGAAGAG